MDTSPLGVVNIRFTGVNAAHDPASIVHQYLKMFFSAQPDSLVYGLREFEIVPSDFDTLAAHHRALEGIVAKMERCAHRWQPC
jgi:hypothetical protein